MAPWSAPLAVTVALRSPTGATEETRRVPLPNGVGMSFDGLLVSSEERFGRPLERRLAYQEAGADRGGEVLTVSSDKELREALLAGAGRFEVREALQQQDRDGAWEFVEAARANPVESKEDPNPAWSDRLCLWLNGEEVVLHNPSPTMTLLEWLRDVRGLTGTHVGCGEGGCGICTVSLTRKDPGTGQLRTVPINSCLRRICALDGCSVVTTEGVGCKNRPHALQKAIAEGNGSQCGFCTPGWVMNMYALLDKNSSPSRTDVERHFDGNLCRCTGYRPILTAFGDFAKGGKKCGQHVSVPQPPALLAHDALPLHFVDPATRQEWYRPLSLEQLLAATQLAAGRKLRPVCANTADGVAKYYKAPDHNEPGTVFLDVSLLPELQHVRADAGALLCGAAASIEELIEQLTLASKDTPSFGVLADHMRRIASVQIRSVASWAGNLMFTREYPSFPSDMVTILAAAGACFAACRIGCSTSGAPVLQTLTLPQLLSLEGDALVVSMTIPRAPEGSVFKTFKTAQRSVFSHPIVNFGALVAFEAAGRGGAVSEARIFLGGTCKTLLMASRTATTLRGRSMDQSTFELALAALKQEIAANASEDLRTSHEYRWQLAAGFLYKLFLAAQPALPPRLTSALVPLVPAAARPVSSGQESYGTETSETPISQYIPKRSSLIQACGEALYASDHGHGALFGQLVLSQAAGARLLALDPSEALTMPGVHGFVAASAVPGVNCITSPLGGDNLKEKVFFEVNDIVPCVGSPLGLILASSWREARAAAKRVVQRFAGTSSGSPAVVASIDDAVLLRRILPGGAGLAAGAPGRRGARPELAAGVAAGRAAALDSQERSVGNVGLSTVKGKFRTGGQRHFYMETQSVCVTPHDGDHWEVVISDQDCNFTQACLAAVLGVSMHHINVKMPRAGGAFGGKLSRQMFTACAAAVAASRFRRPVRIQNERSDDMQLVGGREPLDFEYEVSFDASGKVDSMDLKLTVDPGWLYGDVKGDVGMAVGWSDNCYHYQSFKVDTQAALTDTPHNTSMRAPGCMQSILAAEVVMEHVASAVGRPVEEVQALNFYQASESPVTPFGDHIGKDGYNWTIPILWPQIQEQSNFKQRKESTAAFNQANRWRKKGIAISPVKYGIDMSTVQYSSGALVCVYQDGTVLVSTGGSEVGQGLNTKVALCVAATLGAPLEKVQVGPRETSKVPDNTCTGGSGTSECSSQAAIFACQKLLDSLKPYRQAGQTWEDAVAKATADKVGLMATGWYEHTNTNTNSYATYGTAVSEVLVDILTGEVRVERVDVLMDLGTQLDAAVDIGQLQGGFVMALGYLLSEQLKVDSTGTQLNLGTWEYKIPTAYDIPVEFNVSLLKNSPNPVGVKGSKASAEPAMCLLPSVYLAAKAALYAARQEVGLGESWFALDIPLTPEAVRAAAGVTENQLQVS